MAMLSCAPLRPANIELACFRTVRKDTFHGKTFFACLAASTFCVVLLPLFVTGTTSFGAAREECYDRTVERLHSSFFDIGSQVVHDPTQDHNFDNVNTRHLFPVHLFNSIATVVSLFGFCVWLFFSPHTSDRTQNLDRTCKTMISMHFTDLFLMSACSVVPRVCVASGKLLCPSMVGEPPCHGGGIVGELHFIGPHFRRWWPH